MFFIFVLCFVAAIGKKNARMKKKAQWVCLIFCSWFRYFTSRVNYSSNGFWRKVLFTVLCFGGVLWRHLKSRSSYVSSQTFFLPCRIYHAFFCALMVKLKKTMFSSWMLFWFLYPKKRWKNDYLSACVLGQNWRIVAVHAYDIPVVFMIKNPKKYNSPPNRNPIFKSWWERTQHDSSRWCQLRKKSMGWRHEIVRVHLIDNS